MADLQPHPLHVDYQQEWRADPAALRAWQQGRTGFPAG